MWKSFAFFLIWPILLIGLVIFVAKRNPQLRLRNASRIRRAFPQEQAKVGVDNSAVEFGGAGL